MVDNRTAVAVVGALVGIIAQPRCTAAEEKLWTAAAGAWTEADNWSPPGQPQADDEVTITTGAAALAVDTAIAGLTLSGGTLSGSGTLTVNGPMHWTAGTMSGSGTTVAVTGMELGGTNKTLDARALVLSGGTAAMNASGSFISMRNGATITNQAVLELSNDGGLTNNQGFFHGGSGGGAFINHGTLRKLTAGNSGITRFAGISFDNIGTVEVLAGSLGFSGGYTQTAGVTRLNSGTLVSDTTLVINGGTLEGFGELQASVTSVGEVGPGLSAGALQITGTHTQHNGGTLIVEIGGPEAGAQYDQLIVGGAASLDGTLEVRLIDGFTPSLGQRFEVMTFGERSGMFSMISGLDLSGALALEATYGATNLLLEVVSVSVDPTRTATALVTPPTATPTATPNGVPCTGDCDGDTVVRINELVFAVNLALGDESTASCPAIDADGDDAVAVNELVAAVIRSLQGCPG